MALTKEEAARSRDLATYGFKLMRLYSRDYKVPLHVFADALAVLCIEVRKAYPAGTDAFDAIAAAAQDRLANEETEE